MINWLFMSQPVGHKFNYFVDTNCAYVELYIFADRYGYYICLDMI